jgi:hypothetical protein
VFRDNDVVRGLFRRSPNLDFVRAQDVFEVAGRDDETLLAWTIKNERVVLTHDLATMVPALRLQGRRASTAIVLVPDSLPIGQVIEDVLLLDECSNASDWTAGVIDLPLR